jgi:hypothetical protein
LLYDHHLNTRWQLEKESNAKDRPVPILLNALLGFFSSSIGNEAADG